MPPIDDWRWQEEEHLKEAARLHDRFRTDREPNVDDLDKATEMHEEWCRCYNYKEITFKEFIEIGKSLRTRQAQLKTQRTLK